MRIYRVEHKDTCEGVYNYHGNGYFSRVIFGSTSANNNWPFVEDDKTLMLEYKRNNLGIDLIYGNSRYGFSSMKQFYRWFPVDKTPFEKLHGFGMVLSVYDVPEALCGTTQAVFNNCYHVSKNKVDEYCLLDFAKTIDFII